MIVVLRVLVFALLTGVVLVPAAAHAGPAPSAPPKPGEKVCKIKDDRLAEISGLVTYKKGYIALPDGGNSSNAPLAVYELSADCEVTQQHTFPAANPYDPEDLAITGDGTLWVADTGDNQHQRDRVALWKIPPDRGKATLYRLTYPDGKHDAEALLVQPDGKPAIITKEANGASGVYVPQDELKSANESEQGVPLKKAGEVKIARTGTPGGELGPVSQVLVTGATLSSDGSRAVLRTYTDAYEWKVSGGDVVKALTTGKPIRTALPNEPQGESITYSKDGTLFITASEAVSKGDPAQLYSYVPAKPPPPDKKGGAGAGDASGGWFDGLQLQDIKILIGVVGVIGLIMVGFGIWGIRRARQGRDPRDDGGDDPDDPRPRRGRSHGEPGRGGPYPGERHRPPDPREYGAPPHHGGAPDYDRPRDYRGAGRHSDPVDPWEEPRRGRQPGPGDRWDEPRGGRGRATVAMPQPGTGDRRGAQARARVPTHQPPPTPPRGGGRYESGRDVPDSDYDQPPGGRYW